MLTPLKTETRRIFPGLAMAGLVAMAAQFLSDHYGAPAMLMAILLGIAFQFLSEEPRTAPGIGMASRSILRIGVALLGVRISLDVVLALGAQTLLLTIAGVFVTIGFALAIGRLFGRSFGFALLSGGSVAICGASAAMAIASVLPRRTDSDRDLSFTVMCITVMSTLAMIVYPMIAGGLGLTGHQTGIFLGATIHDVAQVVGAGYSVSEDTGDLATVIKLIRVSMLGLVVLGASLALRRQSGQGDAKDSGKRPPLLPGFVIAFLIIAGLNSAHLIPDTLRDLANVLSRWALLTAIAAVGMRTSIPGLLKVGGSAIALIVTETLFLMGFILGGLYLMG